VAAAAAAAAPTDEVATGAAAPAPAPAPAAPPAAAPQRPRWDDEPDAPPARALFVHFIPPPMREPGKKDLPWIVHTCDGSACREARHVAFHSLSGFSTFEGQPPEQLAGAACACAISNHHLRGFGRVRWEKGDLAIIEHHGGSASGSASGSGGKGKGGGSDAPMLNVRAVQAEARRSAQQLARAREEVKKLRELSAAQTKQLDAACFAQAESEGGASKEAAQLKLRKREADERMRALQAKHDELVAKHAALQAERDALPRTPAQIRAAAAAAAAAEQEVELAAAQRRAAARDEAREEAERRGVAAPQHASLHLGCLRCVLACVPPAAAPGGTTLQL
jgi:hypothetical protein